VPQILYRIEDADPDRGIVNIAILKKLIGALGRRKADVGTMLVNQQLGGAEDVGVGGQVLGGLKAL